MSTKLNHLVNCIVESLVLCEHTREILGNISNRIFFERNRILNIFEVFEALDVNYNYANDGKTNGEMFHIELSRLITAFTVNRKHISESVALSCLRHIHTE